MANLFLSFWNRSIAASWLILAIVLLRPLLRKAPKSARCLLWLVAGLRLACPFSIESVLSLVPSAETVPQAALAEGSFRINSGIYAFNSTVNDYLRTRQAAYEPGSSVPAFQASGFFRVCAVIWIIGMALLALWALAGWRKIRRQVAEAVPDGDGVWLCDAIASPFLLGVFRPRIYLPTGLEESFRPCVVAHEKAHLLRRDHWTKPLAFLLLTAYWFNPLVWLAYVLLCRDIELACDERVIRELGPEVKPTYSQALLQCSVQRSAVACPLAFGEAGVKERVKNVLNYKKPAFWVAAASLLVVVVVAVCFLTDRPAPSGTPNTVPGFSNLNAASPNQPAAEYTGGALLYQNMSLSAYFSAATGFYASVIEDGDTLIITDDDGETTHYKLEDTNTYKPEELYSDIFQDLANIEEWMGRKLLPENALEIICRVYVSETPDADGYDIREAIWEIPLADGGKQMWIGGGRVFALLDLDRAFDHPISVVPLAALWTYDPSSPTAIPIRFDLEGEIRVWTSDGELSLDIQSGEWTDALITIEPGQTVYWMPDGAPVDGASLSYSYDSTFAGRRSSDSISLRPAMDYEGLYGGRTYGISQDWLGMLSSRFHGTWAGVDSETGELVISCSVYDGLEAQQRMSINGARVLDSVVWDAAAGN